jgi:hypothetical protein
MSDFRYEIKTSLPVIWLETIDTKKIRVGPYATNWTIDQLILVDPVDDEEVVEDSSTDWSSKRLTMLDLKKRKNVIHSSWSNRSSLYYFTLALANILIYQWSQINVLLSIRLTGGRQIDFKVFKPFWMPRKYFQKVKVLKFPKSKQIFSQKINKLSSKI